MKDARTPFNVWLIRIAALRCRWALVHTGGDHARAAQLIGCGASTFSRVLTRDNSILAERMAKDLPNARLNLPYETSDGPT